VLLPPDGVGGGADLQPLTLTQTIRPALQVSPAAALMNFPKSGEEKLLNRPRGAGK